MTLDQTWRACLAMWKWVADEWVADRSVKSLKKDWLRANIGTNWNLQADCFFCQYRKEHKTLGDGVCATCPGMLVDEDFGCESAAYKYDTKPKQFYQKLLELNAKRTGDKNMLEFKWSGGTVTNMIAETEVELREKFSPKPKPKPKFGDMVTSDLGLRIVLYNSEGKLRAHNASFSAVNGFGCGDTDTSFYTPTGQNIFTDNLLDLDM